MKKYIYAFFFASLIIVALGLKAKIKSDTEFSELTLSNIEAIGVVEMRMFVQRDLTIK